MASICCSPPESVPPFWSRRSREHPLEVGGDAVAVGPHEGPQLEVLEHRHAREDATALGRLGDPEAHDAIGGEPVETMAIEGHAAAPGGNGTQDRLQRRRLPGAVGADQGDDLPALHGQRQATQRADVAIVGVDVGQLEHGGYRGASRAASSCS
jgi:hypothetical protein